MRDGRVFITLTVTVALSAVLGEACVASAADSVVLLPEAISLVGREARQTLVVERVSGGAMVGQAVDGVTFTSSDE